MDGTDGRGMNFELFEMVVVVGILWWSLLRSGCCVWVLVVKGWSLCIGGRF